VNYLLDTCVFAEFAKPTANAGVLTWIDDQDPESLFVSVLTIGEIEKGIARLPTSKRRKELERFLDRLIHRFDRHILAVDLAVVRIWGMMVRGLEVRGRSLSLMDSMLAASAIEHGLTIVTRNVGDFTDTGVQVLNIWDD
jgi:tRNA(fMet)-specific endonuclease VapC